MQYTRLTYKERLEVRTWINGQYDFSVNEETVDDPKIRIAWRSTLSPMRAPDRILGTYKS